MFKGQFRTGLAVAIAMSSIAVLAFASEASAATLFWTNDNAGGPISSVGLGNGSTITNLSTGPRDPVGIAPDLAQGRIYYSFRTGIDYVNLDGSGDTAFNTTGATIDNASSLAIDPAAGKLFWTNRDGAKISWANLDGSGGGDLPITTAALDGPHGLVVDPSAGKLYWTNDPGTGGSIASANLDGSDATVLPIASGDFNGSIDLAVDAIAGRVYWTNCDANTIGYANLDGSNASTLSISGATVDCPNSIAIDHAAGKLYFSNYDASPGSISYANLDGSGGGDAVTGTANSPERLALVEPPVAAGAPTVTGATTAGSTLTCTPSWAADLNGAHLYRDPQSTSFTWTDNGTAITGATTSTITAGAGGQYACQATGTNLDGSATSPASAAFTVQAAPAPPAPPAVPPTLPKNTAAPRITGQVKAGKTVVCATGSWTGPPAGYVYAWSESSTPIQGATHASYRVQALDESLTLRCTVVAVNSAGTSQAATSPGINVPVPKITGCPAATGAITAGHLGQIRLGMSRQQAKRAYRNDHTTAGASTDSFCLTPVGVRVGFMTSALLKMLPKRERAATASRSIWAVTSNRHYVLRGIRAGATVSAATHALHPGFAVRIGATAWYLAAKGNTAYVLWAKGGIVQGIGIADARLTHSRAVELRLLHTIG